MFWAAVVPPVHNVAFLPFGYAEDSTVVGVLPYAGEESMNRDLNRVCM